MDNSWAPRKTNWGKVKKNGYLGYKEKKVQYKCIIVFLDDSPKSCNQW